MVKEQMIWYISGIHDAKFSPSEQRAGTAKPSIVANLTAKLPDETSPDRNEVEARAHNICAAAFTGELYYHQNSNLRVLS